MTHEDLQKQLHAAFIELQRSICTLDAAAHAIDAPRPPVGLHPQSPKARIGVLVRQLEAIAEKLEAFEGEVRAVGRL
jgi:hypothetical protein